MKKKKDILKVIRKLQAVVIKRAGDGLACQIPRTQDGCQYSMCIIMSWGGGWDHVSVHCSSGGQDFTPFWEDMCYVKALFFRPSDTVVQYHPPTSKYINNHKHTLHLWRPQEGTIKLPPIEFV